MPLFDNASNFSIPHGKFVDKSTTIYKYNESPGLRLLFQHIAEEAMHDSRRSDATHYHPNTRMSILRQISAWLEDRNSPTRIMWISGYPGVGKSTIQQTLAQKLQDEERLAGSFFFNTCSSYRNESSRLVSTLAYQLTESIPRIRPIMSTHVENHSTVFLKSPQRQFKLLIADPLNQVYREQPDMNASYVMVIDALDECKDEEQQLMILRLFAKAIEEYNLPLKIIFSSRPEYAITTAFETDLAHLTYHIPLIKDKDTDEDIEAYLRSNLTRIRRAHPSIRFRNDESWPSDELVYELVKRADGQFVFVSTLIKYIDVRHELPSERLTRVMECTPECTEAFAQIDRLYARVIRSHPDPMAAVALLRRLIDGLGGERRSKKEWERCLGLEEDTFDMAFCHMSCLIYRENHGDSEVYLDICHTSLRDFICNSRRAKEWYMADETLKDHKSRFLSLCHGLIKIGIWLFGY